MRTVKGLLVIAAALVVVPTLAHAKKKAAAPKATIAQPNRLAAATPSPHAKAESTPTEATQVFGTLPDWFAGTWLVIRQPKIGEQYRNAWYAYRISHTDADWQLSELAGTPPQAVLDALRDANKRNVPLELDAATLAAAKSMVATLTRPAVDYRSNQIFLRDADHLRPNSSPPEGAQSTKFVIELLEKGGANTIVSGWSYWVTAAAADKMSGVVEHGSVAIAGASVVPIAINGTFVMYRLQ